MSVDRPDPGREESERSRRAEKERQWQSVQKRVETITDGLGLGVDEGIKETVTGFLANDLETDGSCEGHPDQEHGLPYPWVDIIVPEPEGWDENEKVRRAWTEKNCIQQRRFLQGLDEFYQDRHVSTDVRLTIRPIGIYGGFRVQSTGAASLEALPVEERQRKVDEYKAEMATLTDFLREKFLSKE